MRIALQQNTVWLIQFSFVKDMPSETDDRKGAGLCGEWKALWRVATLCLNGAYQQNEKKRINTKYGLDIHYYCSAAGSGRAHLFPHCGSF